MGRPPQGGSGLHKVRSVYKMRFKAGAFFGEEESSLDVTSRRRAKRTSPESGGPRRLDRRTLGSPQGGGITGRGRQGGKLCHHTELGGRGFPSVERCQHSIMEKDVDKAQSWWAVHQVGLHLVEVLSCIRCWGDAPTTQHQGPREGVLVHWPVKIKDASQG